MAFIPDAIQPNQLEVISQREAALRKTGFTSDGRPAPEAAIVDMGTPPVVAASHAPTPKPTRFVPDPAPPSPAVKADPIGEANAAAQKTEQGPVQDTMDMAGHAAKSAGSAALALGNATLHPIDTLTHLAAALPGLIQHLTDAVTNPVATAQHVGAVLSTASGAQAGDALGPLALGGVAGRGVGLLSDLAAPAEIAADAPAAVAKYGMVTGKENPTAKFFAGESAKPTDTATNQIRANPVLGAQAGVPPGTKITPASLEAGRDAPNSVYERAKTSIPTGPLSPNAAAAVQGVGADDMIVHSPDTQATIEAQKARLLSGPMTGKDVVDAQRALRYNGFKGISSEDPEAQAVGHAQLNFADALHQHMVDTLPENAPVTAEQLAQARVALAQNHTIENVLGPNGDVNLTKLAKLHNDNPGMLSGPMQEIAQFASDHPEVTRLPSDAERYSPSGVGKDLASVSITRPLGSVAQLGGGFFARKVLRGGPSGTVLNPPVTGLAGEFDPIAPRAPAPLELRPAPGAVIEPHQPQLAASSGPYQPPLGLGAPLRPVAPGTHDLSLADELASHASENNSDLAAVLSQGVPDGTVMRAPPHGGLKMPLAGKKGTSPRKRLDEELE